MFLVQQFGSRIRGAIPQWFKMPNEDDRKLHGRTASVINSTGPIL